ncbi:phenmedipham hydrolase [Seiridium cupressi]
MRPALSNEGEAENVPPACPPKTYDGHKKATDVNVVEASSSQLDLESSKDSDSMPPSQKAPWWSRYSGYQKLKVIPPSRTRRAIFLASAGGAITLIVLFVWLAKTHRLSGFPLKDNVKITLPQGTYFGDITPKSDKYPRAIEAWRGVPYAQSTGGDNRFRAPQPLPDGVNSEAIYDARDFGSICGNSGAEDCLNLNIYRPHYGDDAKADAADMAKIGGEGKKLPVVIYVHGGGFNGGSGKERNMASFVSWAAAPIIGISFNYRVGALGFLPSPLSQKAGVLNLGLKDQQMLLAWVQSHVASFGGDPDNVTLMGLSAGAHSIGHQLISYAPANKLTKEPAPFHKVVMESGGPTARAVFAPSHPLHEKQFREFLKACGLSGTPDAEVFTQLRALPLAKIQYASNSIWNKYNRPTLRWAFQPSIDGPGGIIPDLPLESWKKGNALRIPIMSGFDTNEGATFVPTKDSGSKALRNLMGGIIPALNETSLKTMENIYPDPLTTIKGKQMYVIAPPAGFGKQFWRLDDAYAHYAYICPVLQTGHFASTATDSKAPVYIYHFAARSAAHGATDHGDEAPVVAHDQQVLANYPGLTKTADSMTSFWSRFAAFGDPNPTYPNSAADSSMTWEKFTSPFSDKGDSTSGGKGQVALFAEGNDERMGVRGRSSFGVPAQTIALTDRELMECRYWFDRVIYSEGFGDGNLTFT